MKYRTLEPGERIKDGDQEDIYGRGEWGPVPSVHVGGHVSRGIAQFYRRPIPEELNEEGWRKCEPTQGEQALAKALAEIERLKEQCETLRKCLRNECEDWASDDTKIKELCRPYCKDVDGDSFYIPGMTECAEEAIATLVARLTACERLRQEAVASEGRAMADVEHYRNAAGQRLDEATKLRNALIMIVRKAGEPRPYDMRTHHCDRGAVIQSIRDSANNALDGKP